MTVPATGPEPAAQAAAIEAADATQAAGDALAAAGRKAAESMAKMGDAYREATARLAAPAGVADTGEAASACCMGSAYSYTQRCHGPGCTQRPAAASPGTADGDLTKRFARRLAAAEDRAWQTQANRDAAKIRLNAADAREILAALAARDGEVRQLRDQLAFAIERDMDQAVHSSKDYRAVQVLRGVV